MYRSIGGGAYSVLNGTLITGTRYTDLDMVDGQHCYRVTAVGTTGLEGSPSNTSCVSPPSTALASDGSTALIDSPDVHDETGMASFSATVRPNPLRGDGTLVFTVTRTGPVKAVLYDLAGRRVKTFLDAPKVAPGRHEIALRHVSDHGTRLPAGIYLYRVEGVEGVKTGRVVVLD
jgi:hypothetical protein